MSAKRYALNYYLAEKTREDGTRVPFGKIGFTILTDKTDRYVAANVQTVAKAMLAGELTDLNGEVALNGAAIDVIAIVREIDDDAEVEQVTSLRNTAGGTVNLSSPAPADDDDDLFE